MPKKSRYHITPRTVVEEILWLHIEEGYTYKQLADGEQEQNGLYTYEREAKLDPAWGRSVVSRKAAIEKED